MTTKQIETKRAALMTKFDAAQAIKKILEDAKKSMGKELDEDATEAEILALVTDEE